MQGLEGKRVVLTGAGGGLGRALVGAFAAAGAHVVACDRPGWPAAGAERVAFDLTDREAVARAAATILAGGTPDILILNAGVTEALTLDEMTDAALAAEIEANFGGTVALVQALRPAMRARGGAMVFVASVNAGAHFGNPAYSAAKAALLAIMRAVAVEEGRHGIRANAVVPGSIRTHAWDARIAADAGVLKRVSKLYPLGRIVTPEEVAAAILFLASPLSSGITGATLAVDAGLSAGNLPFLSAIGGG